MINMDKYLNLQYLYNKEYYVNKDKLNEVRNNLTRELKLQLLVFNYFIKKSFEKEQVSLRVSFI